MRKLLLSLLGLSLVGVMAYGVIGSGAFFTASATATQKITVGTMTIVFSDSNLSANSDGTFSCPDVAVMTSSGKGADCHFTLSAEGGIQPNLLTISPSQSGANEPAKFQVFNAAGAAFPISAGHFVYSSLPITESLHVEWTDLGDTSQGNRITLTLAFLASQIQ
jgi:hypothetical protein